MIMYSIKVQVCSFRRLGNVIALTKPLFLCVLEIFPCFSLPLHVHSFLEALHHFAKSPAPKSIHLIHFSSFAIYYSVLID